MNDSIGNWLLIAAEWISRTANFLVSLTVGILIALLLLRWLAEAFNLNPFGRLGYYLRKPTDDLIYYVRGSQFYVPLKQALNFNPTYLMALVAVAIAWYLVLGIIGYLVTILSGFGTGIMLVARGDVGRAISVLIGTALLSVIFFLLTLMTVVFINWISGRFNRAAYWALQRLKPLLRIFEFGGALAGFSFIILWLVLTLAASAVSRVFF